MTSRLVSPRRVTGAEERELLDAADAIRRAEAAVIDARAKRDQLIADLIDHQARIGDIAEVLSLTRKAVRDARDRANQRDI
jgi:hypothetical protein